MSWHRAFTAGFFNHVTTTVFVAAMLACRLGYSQQQPNVSDDRQALMDQMRENGLKIMQNMQAKGIDPGQFFQQMQGGGDPADIARKMVEQGIIDQQTLDQMQTTMQKLSLLSIKDRLQATDAEWAVLEPLLQKVEAASGVVTRPGMGMMMGGFIASKSPAVLDLSKAKQALAAATKDPNTTAEQFAAALKAVRDARDKALGELEEARQALVGVLSVRQEGILASMGIIE
jgi:hypothetical protein